VHLHPTILVPLGAQKKNPRDAASARGPVRCANGVICASLGPVDKATEGDRTRKFGFQMRRDAAKFTTSSREGRRSSCEDERHHGDAGVLVQDPDAQGRRCVIDENTDTNAALSPEPRERATAETAAEVLLAERHEANLMWKALDQGLAVSHRPDADPIAVLGLVAAPAPTRPSVEPQWPMVIERVGV
jgi:hypothetical protein